MTMKFFFEADPEAENANLTPKEESGFFSHQLKETMSGIDADASGFDPSEELTPQSEASISDIVHQGLLHVQFGYVKDDYVFHFSTLNEKRNFNGDKYYVAVMAKVLDMIMPKIPKSLKVIFTKPNDDFEIRTTSIKIEGAKGSFSFDHILMNKIVEDKVAPFLLAELKAPGSMVNAKN